MKLSQLTAFCLVATRGGLQHAARELNVTPGAVSLQLKRLEKETKINLFHRAPNKLLLTQEGRAFLDQTQLMLQEFERGVASIRGGDAGDITICSSNDNAQFLAPRIADFVRRNPSVGVSVLRRSSSESLNLVLEGQADFAVGKFPMLPRSFKKLELYTSGVVALYPKGHPLAQVKRLTLETLIPYGLIVLPQTSRTREAIEKAFATKHLKTKQVLEAGGCSIIKEYVELRLGVGLVHEICIRGKTGPLCTSDAKHLFGRYDVVLIHRTDRPPGNVQRKFIESISRGYMPTKANPHPTLAG